MLLEPLARQRHTVGHPCKNTPLCTYNPKHNSFWIKKQTSKAYYALVLLLFLLGWATWREAYIAAFRESPDSRFHNESHSKAGGLILQSPHRCSTMAVWTQGSLQASDHNSSHHSAKDFIRCLKAGNSFCVQQILFFQYIYLEPIFSRIFHLKNSKTFPWIKTKSTSEKCCTDFAGWVT